MAAGGKGEASGRAIPRAERRNGRDISRTNEKYRFEVSGLEIFICIYARFAAEFILDRRIYRSGH